MHLSHTHTRALTCHTHFMFLNNEYPLPNDFQQALLQTMVQISTASDIMDKSWKERENPIALTQMIDLKPNKVEY